MKTGLLPIRLRYLAVLLSLCGVAAAQSQSVSLQSSSAPVSLDGRLDEPAWRDSPVLELVQQSPSPGAETPYQTEVRLLLTEDTLYLGFTCRDPEPGKIAIHTMRRDGDIDGDDSVGIVLDTYGDRRTGYFFRANAAGTRVDGLVSDPENPAFDWDGIWDVRTARTTEGWTAEIQIPARTLSFTKGLNQWGLNLERFVPRERVTLRWASPTLDSFFYDLSRSGSLAGVGELRQGLGLEISPYATGRTTDFFSSAPRAFQGAAGGEVTWKVTSQLVGVFTLNTDFAETEVDARQINLTRFPLFFPEKRAFFLEGSNQYEFGLGLGELFVPFFSRRIGLLQGAQVPIAAGVKLNGRIGRLNVALLDVQTRAARVGTQIIPGQNLLAGRISYDVNSKLRLGNIFTHGDPEGLRRNSLAGFDAVWRTSSFRGNKNFLVGGWTAFTRGEHGPGSRAGWGFKVDYPNDLWDCNFTLHRFGDALQPLLGFLPRPGRRLGFGCSYQPRPSKDGWLRGVRQMFFENFYTRVTNSQGVVETWRFFSAPINARLESGERVEFNAAPEFQLLLAPFEIVPGVVIPPGGYHFTRWRVEAQSSPHRSLQAGSTIWFGDFYNGDLSQWEQYVRWTSPKGRLQLEASAENNFGHLPQGNFVQRLWQFQSALAWNPNLVLTTFVQYDTESQNVGANTRLRWTIKPGNDLFMVWNRGWRRLSLSPGGIGLVPDSDLIAVKLRWTFRF